MKSLNTFQFISNAAEALAKNEAEIANAETYEKARNRANHMIGYLNCLITFLNTMICLENNDFTAEYSDVLDDWQARCYQALAKKAIETEQESTVIIRILKLRDEYRPGAQPDNAK